MSTKCNLNKHIMKSEGFSSCTKQNSVITSKLLLYELYGSYFTWKTDYFQKPARYLHFIQP